MRVALAFLLAASAAAGAAEAQQSRTKVKMGMLSSLTDAPIFMAIKKGYFAEEGFEIEISNFRSAANMVAPLGTGQLDTAAGSPSAGLYNAVGRGVGLRIVADKTRSAPGYGASIMLVRKDHVESGRYKELKDIKGMRFAMNAPGVSNNATLNYALLSVGMKYSDVMTIDMGPADHITALSNKGVDASVSLEPFATFAMSRGIAVAARRDDEIDPHHQLGTLIYGETFAARRGEAVRFMRAYLRGIRFYLKALKDGRLAGENADEVIAALVEFTSVKDPAVLRAITPSSVDPDGAVNVKSLQRDLDFYASQGLITVDVSLPKIVDQSFAAEAAKALGPFE